MQSNQSKAKIEKEEDDDFFDRESEQEENFFNKIKISETPIIDDWSRNIPSSLGDLSDIKQSHR